MLISSISYSQSATVHFFYGTDKMLGGEMLFNVRGTESLYLGGGFSGALEQNRTIRPIADDEKWCSLYAVGSLGYYKSVLIKSKAGLAVYTGKNTFEEVLYKPLVGIGVMYELNQDFGIEGGFDTFNGVTIGFTVIF